MLRNIFKGLYSVPKGDRVLIVGETSCHEVSVPVYKLSALLPASGTEPEYLTELGRLGAAEPERILNKLMSSGCLSPVRSRFTPAALLKSLLNPSLKLISSQVQAKGLGFLKAGTYSGEILFRFAAGLASAGLLCSLPLLFFDWRSASQGAAGGALLPAILIVSIIVHELGHSIFAYLNGIGFRPIGFSLYLVYPVFYTNVSGVGELPLKGRLSVNLGGLAFQSAFAFLLFLAYAVSGEKVLLYAVYYILYLLLVNLNPLISTDGYWCWKDMMDAYRRRKYAKYFQRGYDLLSVGFSVYLLYIAYSLLLSVFGYLRGAGKVPGWMALANAYIFIVLLKGVADRFKLYLPKKNTAPVEHPFILPPNRGEAV